MTEKLYYRDPFLMDFTAAVLSCEMVTDAYRVVLDRTAFYPEAGRLVCPVRPHAAAQWGAHCQRHYL